LTPGLQNGLARKPKNRRCSEEFFPKGETNCETEGGAAPSFKTGRAKEHGNFFQHKGIQTKRRIGEKLKGKSPHQKTNKGHIKKEKKIW